MDSKTFQKFREIVYKNSGISLNESKKSMVSYRIAKRMRVLNMTDPKQYLRYLTRDKSGGEIIRFLDVISTNVTSFFREHEHFEFLGEVVSEWINKGKKKIRIWSAASSTGEEPYSIAMTVLVASSVKNIDIKILATDISTEALIKAQAGKYEAEIMEKVPQSLKRKFFFTKEEEDETFYIARDFLKRLIIFRRLNLSKTPFKMRGQLDVVFCRNVMIYFDEKVRSKLVSEIYRLLKTDGYLFTGLAESLTTLNTDFKCIRPSIHKKYKKIIG